jgi:hypothetical protein
MTSTVTDKLPSPAELKEDVVVASKSSLQSLRALAAGGVGGICAVVVGHPFDLVKVRLQTAEKGVYTGAMDVVRKTIAREGLARGLYAGVSAPLVGVTPMCEFSRLLCLAYLILGERGSIQEEDIEERGSGCGFGNLNSMVQEGS